MKGGMFHTYERISEQTWRSTVQKNSQVSRVHRAKFGVIQTTSGREIEVVEQDRVVNLLD